MYGGLQVKIEYKFNERQEDLKGPFMYFPSIKEILPVRSGMDTVLADQYTMVLWSLPAFFDMLQFISSHNCM